MVRNITNRLRIMRKSVGSQYKGRTRIASEAVVGQRDRDRKTESPKGKCCRDPNYRV